MQHGSWLVSAKAIAINCFCDPSIVPGLNPHRTRRMPSSFRARSHPTVSVDRNSSCRTYAESGMGCGESKTALKDAMVVRIRCRRADGNHMCRDRDPQPVCRWIVRSCHHTCLLKVSISQLMSQERHPRGSGREHYPWHRVEIRPTVWLFGYSINSFQERRVPIRTKSIVASFCGHIAFALRMEYRVHTIWSSCLRSNLLSREGRRSNVFAESVSENGKSQLLERKRQIFDRELHLSRVRRSVVLKHRTISMSRKVRYRLAARLASHAPIGQFT